MSYIPVMLCASQGRFVYAELFLSFKLQFTLRADNKAEGLTPAAKKYMIN